MAEIASSAMPSFLGFYIRNLGANLLGFVVIALLNSFTPLEFFRLQRDYIFTQGGWKVFFLFSPLATSSRDLDPVPISISHLEILQARAF